MSEKVSFNNVDLLLVDPRAHNRSSLRHTLNDLDFCEIQFGANIEDIKRAVEGRVPDLLITDSDMPDGDICELIKAIRANKLGSNPFLPVIVITWNPSDELVNKVINSGADDLLVQPISRSQLRDRIKVLTFNRKPFVVTATYIGPDRRKQPRPGRMEVPLIEVPNTLHAKATGVTDIAGMQRAIDLVIGQVNQQKLERNAFHIDYMVNQILPMYERGQFDHVLRQNLHELLLTAQDAANRVIGTRFEYVSKLCRAMTSVVLRLARDLHRPAAKDLQILPELSVAIKVAFEDGEDTATLAQDISSAVQRTGTG